MIGVSVPLRGNGCESFRSVLEWAQEQGLAGFQSPYGVMDVNHEEVCLANHQRAL